MTDDTNMYANPGTNKGEGPVEEGVIDYLKLLREKILFGLEVYPYVSPSMLHVFLGTATSAHVWKSILNDLIAEGLVTREEVTLTTPHDRTQTYTILHLTQKPYTAFPTSTPQPNAPLTDAG